MRRPILALSAVIGLSASIALAQQSSRAPEPDPSSSTSADPADPAMAGRPTRYLLRNGIDYLSYREYARALTFFRAVEARQARADQLKRTELSDAERESLKKGIAKAQQGLREAVNTTRVASKGRTTVQPGAFALARPAPAPTDPVQLASAEITAPAPAPSQAPAAAAPPETYAPALAVVPIAAPPADPSAPVFGARPATQPAPAGAGEPATLPDPPLIPSTPPDASAPAVPEAAPAPLLEPTPAPRSALPEPAAPSPLPDPDPTPASSPAPAPLGLEPPSAPEVSPLIPASAPTADPLTSPAQATSPIELPPANSASSPVAVPVPTEPASAPVAEPSAPPATPSGIELPPIEPASAPIPTEPAPIPSEPAPVILPASEPVPSVIVPPRLADASRRSDPGIPALPTSAPEPPPAPEASPLPPLPGESSPMIPPSAVRQGDVPRTILSDRLSREVEQIAQRPTGDDRQPGSPAVDPNDPNAATAPSQGSTRLAIERAPSPTEARPMRRIPVPEDFVPLGQREWNPNRKYWAAAGTCHMILYFQDPVLERYGQGVEQSLGPVGRYFSYPLDDPKQSNQRNQILQPFYSMGKFCFQVGTLPYKLVVDPPWEAEYDLGYYRPGDRIPADTIMITPYGVGPPGHGRNY